MERIESEGFASRRWIFTISRTSTISWPLPYDLYAANKLFCLAATRSLAREGERDEVFFGIVTGVAANLFVMDFEVRPSSAGLTRQPSRRSTC